MTASASTAVSSSRSATTFLRSFQCDPIKLTVDEDDIDARRNCRVNRSAPARTTADGDGSFTGNPNTNRPGPANVSGHLQGPGGVVIAGADEPLTFSFVHNTESIFLNLGLESKGEALRFDVQGNVLYGYAPNFGGGVVGYDGTDRLVFKFTLESDGDFKFELYDQLDHDKRRLALTRTTACYDGSGRRSLLDRLRRRHQGDRLRRRQRGPQGHAADQAFATTFRSS